jgi:conjugative transfer signal peptidase TraF
LTTLAGAGCAAFASRFTLNLTSSLPRGIYLLRSTGAPQRGSIVAFDVPPALRELVAARNYLPPGARLLKRVVAVAGDSVCTNGNRYVVDEQLVSDIAPADARGLSLPAPYPFCGVVPPGVAFVAGAGASSLDSRYFGPLPLATLTTTVPIWTFSSR